MSIQKMVQYNPDDYFILQEQGIDIYFQVDAYFMVSGLRKLTISLSHTSYGDFLAIQEFESSPTTKKN